MIKISVGLSLTLRARFQGMVRSPGADVWSIRADHATGFNAFAAERGFFCPAPGTIFASRAHARLPRSGTGIGNASAKTNQHYQSLGRSTGDEASDAMCWSPS
jgi:hypothetical protein